MKRCQYIVFAMAMLLAVGCATPCPTVSSSHNSEHANMQSHDERIKDSTLIDRLREVIIRNDTVYIHDSIYIAKWYERVVTDTIHDTLYIEHTDTITQYVEVEKPVEVEVEKPIAPFVRNSCIALWLIIGVAILALVAWLVWKFATGKFSWAKIGVKLLSWIK